MAKQNRDQIQELFKFLERAGEWVQALLVGGLPLLCLAIGLYVAHKFGNHDGWPW